MSSVQLREAKARLSKLVEAAERGESTTITKHGKPAAVIVPVAEAGIGQKPRSVMDVLRAIPGDLEIERDGTPMRSIDL